MLFLNRDQIDNLPPEVAIPISIVLFVIFFILVLTQRRRFIEKQRARRRAIENSRRRETFIAAELERDPIPGFIEGYSNENSTAK